MDMSQVQVMALQHDISNLIVWLGQERAKYEQELHWRLQLSQELELRQKDYEELQVVHLMSQEKLTAEFQAEREKNTGL